MIGWKTCVVPFVMSTGRKLRKCIKNSTTTPECDSRESVHHSPQSTPIGAILLLFKRHDTMRKIEQQMNNAISNNLNWQSGNTAVAYNPETNESTVFLHGNKIAVVGDDFVQIFDGGWQSVTTKSRLNAILSEHGIKGECVFQKNFKWYVDKFIGQAGTSPVYNRYDFTNGFMFA